jgi:hypothetical protein
MIGEKDGPNENKGTGTNEEGREASGTIGNVGWIRESGASVHDGQARRDLTRWEIWFLQGLTVPKCFSCACATT